VVKRANNVASLICVGLDALVAFAYYIGPFKFIESYFCCASRSYETNFETKIAPLRSL